MSFDHQKKWALLEKILIALFLALLIRTFVLTGYQVTNDSMSPTLIRGDFVFSYRLPFGIRFPWSSLVIGGRTPEKGEVIVLKSPENAASVVRRVVAVEGDRVEIKNGQLLINEEKQAPMESEFDFDPAFQMPVLIVPPDEIFVLADFRKASQDSTEWGTVPTAHVQGIASLIWLSIDWEKNMKPALRWTRSFQWIH